MKKEDYYRIREEVYRNAGMDKFDLDLMMKRVVTKAVEEGREECAKIAFDMVKTLEGHHAKGASMLIFYEINARGQE